MTIRESIHIRAPKEKVWTFIADPSCWLVWNPKLIDLRRNRTGLVVEGEQLTSKWRLKKREQQDELLIQRVEPQKLLRLRQHFNHNNRARTLEITFEIEERSDGVEVRQLVDHAAAGMPLAFRILMWLIVRFGRARGPSSLEKLKRLAESS